MGMGKGIIDNFNNSVEIRDVYERVTGMKIGRNKNCKCPFHLSSKDNHNNAAIDIKRNSFSCFSHKCATGMKAYEFIAKYNNLENEKFPIIAKKINEYYPNSFKIYSKNEINQYCKLSNFYIKIEKDFRDKIQERINLLNNFFFNKQGINVDIDKMEALWNCIKFNEFYESIANYIKIDRNIGSFKIDDERLNIEITNRVLKYRNKYVKSNKIIKNIVNIGKKLANEYKLNPEQELKEKLHQYRLEYKLLVGKKTEIKINNLSLEEKLRFSNKSGLKYLGNDNIEELLKKKNLYKLNKQICELISENERDAFICGNLDYTISMLYIKPFNYNNKYISNNYIKYVENRLEYFRKQTGSTLKDRYFCDKELRLNKKLRKFFI
ncbi:TPA: hypothetical protein LA462_000309 [Clostridium botulinum]|nr:hypothetical protein [Clostridium botulinum]